MIALLAVLAGVATVLGYLSRRARLTMPAETELRLALNVGFGTIVVLSLVYASRLLRLWIAS